jgi:dTDP-L-rhamnose 4-epimerase
MSILITGGAGFIGSALIPRIRAHSREPIVCVDSLHPQVHGHEAAPPAFLAESGVHFVQGDVTDVTIWESVLATAEPSTVIHLAAETGTGQSLLEATRHTHVNVTGTAVMLDALAQKGRVPQKFVLASSRAVYGEGAWIESGMERLFYPGARSLEDLAAHRWEPAGTDGCPPEFLGHDAKRVEPRPTNVYAATKLAQEHVVSSWSAAMGAELVILRLQNVYGAGQAVGNPYTGVLTYFARQMLSGERVSVFEGGGIVRDFVHVSDVATLLASLATSNESSETPGSATRVFDVGSGSHATLESYARALAALVPGSSVTTSSDYRLGDVRAAFAHIGEAQQELGYSPAMSFERGAPELLQWVGQHVR